VKHKEEVATESPEAMVLGIDDSWRVSDKAYHQNNQCNKHKMNYTKYLHQGN
jgi:hypothetical protein